MATPGNYTFITPWTDLAWPDRFKGTVPFLPAIDAAQAAQVHAEAAEAAADRWRWDKKQKARRSAKAVAQLLLGRRLRACGVAYTPELEHLAVDTGDGTRAQHYYCMLHGCAFALGEGDALVVWRVGADVWRPLKVWDRVDLGRAVEELGGVRR